MNLSECTTKPLDLEANRGTFRDSTGRNCKPENNNDDDDSGDSDDGDAETNIV